MAKLARNPKVCGQAPEVQQLGCYLPCQDFPAGEVTSPGRRTKSNPAGNDITALFGCWMPLFGMCHPWHMPHSSWMRNESPLVSLLPQTRSCSIAQSRPARIMPAGCGALSLLPLGPLAAQGCAQPRLGQWSGKQMAAPSGKQGGGHSPGTCWNKIIRFRLVMPMCFSCTDPASTAAVPRGVCKTSHRVDHSGCCKIRILLIPDQICKVREYEFWIWTLKLSL